MKNFILLTLVTFSFGLSLSQNYYYINNNAESQPIFNFTDKNSLIHILLENKWVMGPSGAVYSENANYEGCFTFEIKGDEWTGWFQGQLVPYMVTASDSKYEDWVDSISKMDFDAAGVGVGWFPDVMIDAANPDFKMAWIIAKNKAKKSASVPLLIPDLKGYFEFRDLSGILVSKKSKSIEQIDSSDIVYFLKRSSFNDEKLIVTFSCPLVNLINLKPLNNKKIELVNYEKANHEFVSEYIELTGEIKENVISKVRNFQFEKMEQNDSLAEQWIIDYREWREGDPSIGRIRSKPIVSLFQGQWINFTTNYLELKTFDDWYNYYRNNDVPPLGIDQMGWVPEIEQMDKSALQKSWNNAMMDATKKKADQILRLDEYAVFWVGYDNPSVYVRNKIEKNNSKYTKKPIELILTRNLNDLQFEPKVNPGIVPDEIMILPLITASSQLNERFQILKEVLGEFSNESMNYEWEKLFKENKTMKKIDADFLKRILDFTPQK